MQDGTGTDQGMNDQNLTMDAADAAAIMAQANDRARRALEPGAGSLFAKDAVLGKLRVQPAYDEFFRCSICFGHQVYIAFIFRGDTALEVAAKQFTGL